MKTAQKKTPPSAELDSVIELLDRAGLTAQPARSDDVGPDRFVVREEWGSRWGLKVEVVFVRQGSAWADRMLSDSFRAADKFLAAEKAMEKAALEIAREVLVRAGLRATLRTERRANRPVAYLLEVRDAVRSRN